MSPRSEEFVERGHRRLRAARHSIESNDPEAAVSSAYYAMLYAARGALSEVDVHAKTHGGTWSEFARAFVASGRIDQEVGGLGAATQRAREDADYEAEDFTTDQASAILVDAERFVAAIEAALT